LPAVKTSAENPFFPFLHILSRSLSLCFTRSLPTLLIPSSSHSFDASLHTSRISSHFHLRLGYTGLGGGIGKRR
jgi:hypothetical protein